MHIVGGDWNAGFFPQERRGYSEAGTVVQQADERFRNFATRNTVTGGWWAGRVVEGLLTRRHPSTGHQARLDEILVHGGKEAGRDWEDRWLRGNTYTLRTAHPGAVEYDHGTVYADLSSRVLRQPRESAKAHQTQRIDRKQWEEESMEWAERVRTKGEKGTKGTQEKEKECRLGAEPDMEGDKGGWDLRRWISIARGELPRKSIHVGGKNDARRKIHHSQEQSILTRQVKELERELLRAHNRGTEDARVERSVRQIEEWSKKGSLLPIEGPEVWNEQTRGDWIAAVRDGISERKREIKEKTREQRKEKMRVMKEGMRRRMDRPREKEIARLMGKRAETGVPVQVQARNGEKRHPSMAIGTMGRDKWRKWFEWSTDTDPDWLDTEWKEAEREGWEARTRQFYKNGVSTRITVHKGRDVKVQMRPLQHFTRFLSVMPVLEEGETITVQADSVRGVASSNSTEEIDSLAEQECFFGANAMPNRPKCGHCKKEGRAGQSLTPMAWGAEGLGGDRTIRYYCHQCRHLERTVEAEPLKPCPIPDDLFENGKLDPNNPILTRSVGWEEFKEWVKKLPKGKSSGPDELTYEMWQEAPEEMRELLWQAVNRVNAGGRFPVEWEGAYTKLLVKKAGEEGILESLRPVCLMNTAAKIITGIWAHRLSVTLEAQGVLEDVQEGFRPERSTKRQVIRLLSCINDAKREGKKLFVTFLDFENYFNTISLNCLFELLRKFGMAEEDIQLLEGYYQNAYFQVVQENGNKTARINLDRGLRQGCPLSPILGGVVVNALIRWLESRGGGYKHSSGEEYNTLLFADDGTLLTESKEAMQRLLNTVESFSLWSGVKVNLRKSEISGYDFRNEQAIWVGDLTLGAGCMTYLKPTEAFKYLGIRLSITGDMSAEKEHIKKETVKLIKAMKGHQYSPSQMHWVVQVAVIPVFRYSAAIAGWSETELQDLEKAWIRAYRQAWRTGASVPGITFWASKEHGGLGCVSAKAIITQEVIGLMRQCGGLDDDLHRVSKYELKRAVKDRGCATLEEACKEDVWEGAEWKASKDLYDRFIRSVSRSMSMKWEMMLKETSESGEQENMEGDDRGIMTLMSQEAPEGRNGGNWRSARGLLRRLPEWGIYTVGDVRDGKQLILPEMLQSLMTLEEKEELRVGIEEIHGEFDVKWLGEEQRRVRTPKAPPLRPAAEGKELIGGRVKMSTRQGYVTGTVTNFDEAGYKMKMSNGEDLVWTLQEVQESWCASKHLMREGWTVEDQQALQSRVIRIVAEKEKVTKHRRVVPFPSRVDESEWEMSEKWYTCTMKAPELGEVSRLLFVTNKDEEAAELLVKEGITFWAPRQTWPTWESAATNTKTGWWVKAIRVRKESKRILLEIRSVHRDEFHRHGDIRVDGPNTLKAEEPLRLRQIMKAQIPSFAVLAEEELSEGVGGFKRCSALRQAREPNANEVDNPRGTEEEETPIKRKRSKAADDLPVVNFTIDWEADKQRVERREEEGVTWNIIRRKGQAHRDKGGGEKQGRRQKRSIKKGGTKGSKITDKQVIDETRWELLKHWNHDKAILEWDKEWRRTVEWENKGGRTLNWTVSSSLMQSRELTTTVRAHTLTVDPSFESYLKETESAQVGKQSRILVPLHEIDKRYREEWIKACVEQANHWIVVTRKEDLSSQQIRALDNKGKLIRRIKPEEKQCLEKGWWKTGERKAIKGRYEWLVWERDATKYREAGQEEKQVEEKKGELAGEEDQLDGFWSPYQLRQSASLKVFLKALPSGKYYEGEATVVATDGSLRLRRRDKEGETMGAGVVWHRGDARKDRTEGSSQGREEAGEGSRERGEEGRQDSEDKENISKRVAGTLSSTRSELAAMAVAIREAKADADLVILIDSAAAIRRLAWFRRRDFRPNAKRTKDLDIITAIVKGLERREQAGSHTTLVKVHGHTGEPLHMVADALATQGADRPLEEGERPLFEQPETTNLTFSYVDESTKRENRGQWSPKVKAWIRGKEAERKWETRTRGTWAETFHSETGVGRSELGEAIQRCRDWAVTGWIKSLTPNTYPVARTFKKWNKARDDGCTCGEGAETFYHLQLVCKLKARRAARQASHDRMMQILEEEIMKDAPAERNGVWNTRVRSLCHQVESVASRMKLIQKWRTEPKMETEFETWHQLMRVQWEQLKRRKWKEQPGEGKEATGKESSGQTSKEMLQEIERRKKEAEARQRAVGKRKQRERPEPRWTDSDREVEVGNLKPDGLIMDDKQHRIYIIEGARCGDTDMARDIANNKKTNKYRALRVELRRRYAQHQVTQINFIMGIKGTIDEYQWRRNLSTMGVEGRRQDRIIGKCMVASIEGMQRVLETKWGSEDTES